MQPAPAQEFERLRGLPLTKTTRNGLVQFFHFGSTRYTTPQGLILDVGEITLALNCPWQLQPPAGDAIKHSEVYIRRRETGLPSPVWDWKVPGSSLRDQRLLELAKRVPALVVARVEQLKEYGFTVYFTDHSTLTVSPDPQEPEEEYWQLFSNTGDGMKVGAGRDGYMH